jgi:hypothetical protein
MDQFYQHRVIENIVEGPKKKISKTSGKISKNVDKEGAIMMCLEGEGEDG